MDWSHTNDTRLTKSRVETYKHYQKLGAFPGMILQHGGSIEDSLAPHQVQMCSLCKFHVAISRAKSQAKVSDGSCTESSSDGLEATPEIASDLLGWK